MNLKTPTQTTKHFQSSFFESDSIPLLSDADAVQYESQLTLEECAKAILSWPKQLTVFKMTPGSDGFTVEFYRHFWHLLGKFLADSFNYAFQNGCLSISQRFGIISLISQKDKNSKFLKHWRPITLLNTDYKIATKAIATRLKKLLPKIINPCQAGYVKGRYIGECIRTISDIMNFTKQKNVPDSAISLDFEKASHSIEWNYLQKCLEVLEVFKFGPQRRQ